MEEELKKLKRQQSTLKGRLTRLEKYVLEIVETEYDIDEIQKYLQILETVFEQFNDIQTKYEEMSDENPTEQEEFEQEQFERRYIYLHKQLKQYLQKLKLQPDTAIIPSTNDIMVSTSTNPSSNRVITEVRLPTLQLPTFDGNFDDWYSFKDLFTAIVEEPGNMSDIHKLYYLRSVIKGTAAEVIKAIPSNSNSYSLAWELLNKRFDNKRLIVEKHNLALIHLPTCTTESVSTLRTLLDTATKNVRALASVDNMGFDSLIVTLVTEKMDLETKRQWRLNTTSDKLPTFNELQDFLERRLQALDSVKTKQKPTETKPPTTKTHHSSEQIKQPSTNSHTNNMYCKQCDSRDHRLMHCECFQSLSIVDRRERVRNWKLCYNCLGHTHQVAACPSKNACRTCQKRHHTLLHQHTNDEGTHNEARPTTALNATSTNHQPSSVLLSTAIVNITDVYGRRHQCRCLLDGGSQTSFITEKLASKLRFPRQPSQLQVGGISQTRTKTTGMITTTIHSRTSPYHATLDLFILPRITDNLPTAHIDRNRLKLPKILNLADDRFHIPGEIDVLIGVEIFFDLLTNGRIPPTNQYPLLQNTKLGWILAGPLPILEGESRQTFNFSVTTLSLTEQLEKFWALDQCAPASTLSKEEEDCENLFIETHQRLPNGHYQVRLPYKQQPTTLGRSRDQAKRRFLSLEKRLQTKPSMKEEYVKFIKEYEALGHLRCLGPETEIIEHNDHYYLPHHCVIKESSTTTKLRVVFDASAKTTTQLSLNDVLMVGPTVQEDLFSIVLRFRKHQCALMADITKMYRQIEIHPDDQCKQLIFWRYDPKHQLQVLQLTTVTYGTAPAPFLATRTLNQLAKDESKNYPIASEAVKDFYVDDLMTGAETIEKALTLQKQLVDMTNSAGFHLRKWATNTPELLENIPLNDQEVLSNLKVNDNEAVKALGLIWQPTADAFTYDTATMSISRADTKRKVLSQIASLFDPLGLLGPIISAAKIFMQNLWQLKLDWDADDLTLTPGHLLIGEPFNSIPEPDLTGYTENRLKRWDRIQRLQQDFWKRWSKEYVTSLHPRKKWATYQPIDYCNRLAIIQEDGLPPLKWKLSRIIEVQPGRDNITRVATVKTAKGTKKRLQTISFTHRKLTFSSLAIVPTPITCERLPHWQLYLPQLHVNDCLLGNCTLSYLV